MGVPRIIAVTGVFALCAFAGTLRAQTADREQDFELWWRAGAKFDATKALQLTIEEQLRFDDNVSAVKNYHTELQVEYEFIKDVELFGAARFVRRNDNQGNIQGYENHFRYQVGLTYGHRLKPLKMDYRLIYQHRNELQLSEAEGDISRQYLRFRTRATYKIKDWKYDPVFGFEYFEAFNKVEAGIEDAIRVGIGTERDYKGIGEFGISYRFERTLGSEFIQQAHVLMLSYNYVF